MEDHMLKLDDARWQTLGGIGGAYYDPRPSIAKLELDADHAPAWQELWNNLFAEGDVAEAAFALVPHLVRIIRERGHGDWNFFALAGTIELERESDGSPAIPDDLAKAYEGAWEELFELARNELSGADESVTLRCLLATIAIAKGDKRRGRMLLEYDDDELDEMLGEFEFDDE